MTKQYPKISRVTGSEVAALAKVDAAVVSKILKEDPDLRVSVETRKRVMDAIEQSKKFMLKSKHHLMDKLDK